MPPVLFVSCVTPPLQLASECANITLRSRTTRGTDGLGKHPATRGTGRMTPHGSGWTVGMAQHPGQGGRPSTRMPRAASQMRGDYPLAFLDLVMVLAVYTGLFL